MKRQHRLRLAHRRVREPPRCRARERRRATAALAGRVPARRPHARWSTPAPTRMSRSICLGPDLAPEAGPRHRRGVRPRATGTVRRAARRADGRACGKARLRAGVRDVVPADADDESLRGALDRATELTGTAAGHAGPRRAPASPVDTDAGDHRPVAEGRHGQDDHRQQPGHRSRPDQPGPGGRLVDLDMQFGDVATVLGLTPEHSMSDVAKAPIEPRCHDAEGLPHAA